MKRDEVVVLAPQEGRPRICIFAAFDDNYARLAEIARPNWEAYARRHGYALVLYPEGFHTDPTRVETYGDKGRFECYYDLRGHCDAVMYLDIDSLFMNHDVRIEDRMGQRFVWTYDDSGPLSGLWIAGTDDLTEKHLRFAYAKAAIENNVRHGVIEPNGISDQDAMRSLMNIPPFYSTFSHCVPAAPYGHCFPENYFPGAWIITFPGMPVAQKFRGMKEYADKCLAPQTRS